MIAKARSALDGVPVSAEEMSKTKAIVQSLLSGPSTMAAAKPGVNNDAFSLPINGPGQRRLVLVQEESGGDDEEDDGAEVPSQAVSHAYTPVDTIDATAPKAPIASTLDEWSRSVIKLGPAPVLTDLGLDPIHTTLKSFPISSLALQKSSSTSTIGSPSANNSVESSPRAPDYSKHEDLDLSYALRDSSYSEAPGPILRSYSQEERDVSPSSPRTAAAVASAASSTQPLQFNIIDHVTKLASSSLDAADFGDTDAYIAEEAGRPEKPAPPTIETYEPSPRPNNATNRRSMYHNNPTMAQDGSGPIDYSSLLKSATAALDRVSHDDRGGFNSENERDVGDDIGQRGLNKGSLEASGDDYTAEFVEADDHSDADDEDDKDNERDHRNTRHKMKASVSFNNIDSFGPDEVVSDEPAHQPLTLSSRTLSQNVLASPPRPTFNPSTSLRNMTTHNPTEPVHSPLPIVEDTHHHHHHSDTKHKHTHSPHTPHTPHTHTHRHIHGSKSPVLYSPRNRDSSSLHTNDADNSNIRATDGSDSSIVEPDDIESLQVKQSIAEQMSLLDAMITGAVTSTTEE